MHVASHVCSLERTVQEILNSFSAITSFYKLLLTFSVNVTLFPLIDFPGNHFSKSIYLQSCEPVLSAAKARVRAEEGRASGAGLTK